MKTNSERREYFRIYKRAQRARAKAIKALNRGVVSRIERLLAVHPHYTTRFEAMLSVINVELRAESRRAAKEQQGGLQP